MNTIVPFERDHRFARDLAPATVKHFVSVTDVGLRSARVTKDGVSELHCEGEVVRQVAKGRYQTFAGIDLTSDDPTAP